MTLTAQQEAFAQALASGESQAEAYRIAYPRSVNWKDQTVWSNASRLASASKVKARVAEIRQPILDELEVSYSGQVQIYRRLAAAAEKVGDVAAARACHDSITKMAGLFAAERKNEQPPLMSALDELTKRHRAKHNGHSTH
jgi:phage terminase small subunit